MGLRNIGPGLCYSAAGILPVVCIICVALRFYCRKTRGIHIGWDDWLVLPALVSLIGMSVAIFIGVASHGVAYSAPPEQTDHDAASKQQTMTRLILWIVYLLGPISLTLVKVSFVLWYRRLFWKGSPRWYRALLTIVTATLIAWGVSFFLTFLFVCRGHPSIYWSTTADVVAKCVKTTSVYQGYATSDTILDVIVILLPMIPLYKLQMSLKRRLGVTGVFMMGALTIVVSILRMVLIWDATLSEYKPGVNIPLLLTSGMYWGFVEGNIALIACCLPTCAVLFKKNRDNNSKYDAMGGKVTQAYSNQSDRTLVGPLASYQTVTAFDKRSMTSYTNPDEIVVTKTYSALPVGTESGRNSRTDIRLSQC